MNILNGNEAFAAMSGGQAVLCRAVGQLLDFSELSQFPATVFFGSEYEFCLAPRFMTIGHLNLDVPECIQGSNDLVSSTMYYAPNLLDVGRPIEILSTTDNTNYLKRLISSKLLHKTSSDAIAHARAFITLNGGSLDSVEAISVKEIVECKITADSSPVETKKRQSRKKTADTSVTIADVEPSGVESEDTPWEVDTTPKPKTKHAFTVDEVEAIEEDPLKIVEKFTAQINACTTTKAVLLLRPVFFANGHLEREHTQQLCKLTEEKLLELDPEQYAPKIEIISQENVTTSEDSLVDSTPEITDFNQPSIPNLINTEAETELKVAQLKEEKYQNLLGELLDRADKSKTPTEANALYKYTMQWTEEQRKPLMRAITKRLQELDQQKEAATEQPPSLMVQIQNALDLTALDVLEIDVASRHPDIQPKLMDLVKKRRFELENQGSQVAS